MPEPSIVRAGRNRRLRILTWQVHGNYLYNLSQVPHDFHLVTDAARSSHHGGRDGVLPWGDNVHEIPLEEVSGLEVDVLLFEHRREWEDEQHRVLSAAQRALPRIVVEHDPPLDHPTDTRHWCRDPGALVVHVTSYNALMWDNGDTPTRIVEHGVKPLASPVWTGEDRRGLVVVNHLARRGRRLGADVYRDMAGRVPLRLVGMGSEALGGEGEVPQPQLPHLLAAHRFFFNPIRYTSLGLAVVEAMMAGMPVIGLATTELASIIDSGRNGYVDTRLAPLERVMRDLLVDRGLAAEWGQAGQRTARRRFGIDRFIDEWLTIFADVTS